MPETTTLIGAITKGAAKIFAHFKDQYGSMYFTPIGVNEKTPAEIAPNVAQCMEQNMFSVQGQNVQLLITDEKVGLVFDGFVEGLKSFIVPALLVTLACSLHLFVYFNDVLTPVMNALLKSTKEFNVFISGLYTIINSIFYVDYYYFASFIAYPITQVYTDKSILSIIDVMFVNLHSLVSLVAPSSVLLLVSLYIGKVRYGEWIKFIWKLALGLLLVSFIVFTIMLLI